jgi:hypothetical protein
LCLSRPLRASYILGDAMGMPDTLAAEVCGISRSAQRQRLARARQTMRRIIANRCGLVDASNPCRCGRQIQASMALGILDPDDLAFVEHAEGSIDVDTIDRAADQLDTALAMSEVYRSDPDFLAPPEVWERLSEACPDLLR